MAKVIWHKTAWPPHTDDSEVLARWHPIHRKPRKRLPWQRLSETWSRLCLRGIASPRKLTPRIKHGVASYHTTEDIAQWKPKMVVMAMSLSISGPPSNTRFVGPCEPTKQAASRLVQPFLHRWPQSDPILYNGTPLRPHLKIATRNLDSHLIHGSLGHPSPQLKRHLDRFSRFAGLTSVTERPTDRSLYIRSVTTGCIYVRAMRPNNNRTW